MIQTRPMTKAEIAARDRRPAIFEVPPSIAEHMAAHMLDIAAVNDGTCLDADLRLRGFTAGEIAHHGTEANRIAILAAIGARA